MKCMYLYYCYLSLSSNFSSLLFVLLFALSAAFSPIRSASGGLVASPKGILNQTDTQLCAIRFEGLEMYKTGDIVQFFP